MFLALRLLFRFVNASAYERLTAMGSDTGDTAVVNEPASEPISTSEVEETGSSMMDRAGRFAMILCAALIGGVAGWFFILQAEGFFTVPAEIQLLLDKDMPSPEDEALTRPAVQKVRERQSALSIALLGVAIGACTGFGVGLARRSSGAMARGAAAGVVLGGTLGAVGGYLASQVESHLLHLRSYEAIDPVEQMRWVMVIHGVEWALLGLAVGLAGGLAAYGMRGALKPAAMAAAGGMIAAPLYSVLASLWFPAANFDTAVPISGGNGMFWVLCVTLFIGLAVSRTVSAAPAAARDPAAAA